ncbi:MAG TPA: hypothetical protein VFU76_08735 [Terriglobales bacterium]|nr:hypothetical protein [Terriglobales bacterium]
MSVLRDLKQALVSTPGNQQPAVRADGHLESIANQNTMGEAAAGHTNPFLGGWKVGVQKLTPRVKHFSPIRFTSSHQSGVFQQFGMNHESN